MFFRGASTRQLSSSHYKLVSTTMVAKRCSRCVEDHKVCDKARPVCARCTRLYKLCKYTDTQSGVTEGATTMVRIAATALIMAAQLLKIAQPMILVRPQSLNLELFTDAAEAGRLELTGLKTLREKITA